MNAKRLPLHPLNPIGLGARVKAYDPIAMDACRAQRPELKIKYCKSALECVHEADALVVVTEWEEFRRLELTALAEAMTTAILVDGRNIFSPDEAAEAGFDYVGIGRRPRGLRVKHEVGALHQ